MKLTTLALAAVFSTATLACGEEASPPATAMTPAPTPPPAVSPDFDITLSTPKLPVLQGATGTLTVTVTRKAGFALPITLDQLGLPAGATLAPVTLYPAEPSTTLTVAAADAAPHSLPTAVTIRATAGAAVVTKPLTVTITGAPGALDTSFAGGKVVLPVGVSDDVAHAMAAQPDGKILLAGRAAEHLGDFAVVRLDRDGTVDPSFGTGGKTLVDFGGADTAYAIAVTADGKILLAGSTSQAGKGDFGLVRLSPTGALDPTFGAGGKLSTDFGGDSDNAYALALLPDGRFVVGGDSNAGGTATGLDFALARYGADGALDPSFGTGGKVTAALASAGGRDSIYDLALETIGGETFILAAGGEGDFQIARFRPDGALDTGFGPNGDGKVMRVFGSVIGAARGIEVAPDGQIVVAGHAGHDFALARLSPAGALDAGFGTGGKVITAMTSTNWDEAQGLAIEGDGKIVVAGWAYEQGSSSGNFALARYDIAGQLDPSFGGTGMVLTEVAAKTKADQATAVLLQVDDRVPTVRVLVAGYANGANSDFAIARYWR